MYLRFNWYINAESLIDNKAGSTLMLLLADGRLVVSLFRTNEVCLVAIQERTAKIDTVRTGEHRCFN